MTDSGNKGRVYLSAAGEEGGALPISSWSLDDSPVNMTGVTFVQGKPGLYTPEEIEIIKKQKEQEKERYARILKEDALFDLYGRAVQDRWRALLRQFGYDKHSIERLGYSHRMRRSRRTATRLGLYLTRPKVVEWLERFDLKPSDVINIEHTTQKKDGDVTTEQSVISVMKKKGNHLYTYTVTTDGIWPYGGNPELPEYALMCTSNLPADRNWRPQFTHPGLQLVDPTPYRTVKERVYRCIHCGYTEWRKTDG